MTSLPPADHDPNRRAEGDPPPDPESTELTGPGAPPPGSPPGATSTIPGETTPAIGSSVFPISAGLPDRYQLTAEIARGAMGVVLRGRDTAFGRDIAVKVLLSAHKDKRELRRRFLEEARITARLQHPGVVPIYEVGQLPDTRPFYVMRMVHGRTLAQLLDARLDPSEDRPRFLRVFEQVCQAAAFAHDQGVIHRDLKPANVMVDAFAVVHVMDWGVAKVLPGSPLADAPDDEPEDRLEPQPDDSDAGTRFGRILGTPAYMSPEQARGDIDKLDERTDVFGLGGILCAILTGQPPYAGTDGREVYRKARRSDLADAFTRLNACGAEAELVALCKRCLSASQDRPRDAGQLARELTDYLESDLRRAARDLIRFFELSLDLFCIAGLDGYFRRVNSNFPRVLGYTTDELISRPFAEFIHPDDRDRTQAEMVKLSQGLPCVRFRNRYRDVRGDYRWFEWMAKSVPEEGTIFAVARDVTDQIRLEDQIRSYANG
jgi:PAS domain S-box-containing protein